MITEELEKIRKHISEVHRIFMESNEYPLEIMKDVNTVSDYVVEHIKDLLFMDYLDKHK